MKKITEEEFITLISKKINNEYDEYVNLAAERNQHPVTWEEFAGYYQ